MLAVLPRQKAGTIRAQCKDGERETTPSPREIRNPQVLAGGMAGLKSSQEDIGKGQDRNICKCFLQITPHYAWPGIIPHDTTPCHVRPIKRGGPTSI